jgi:hypothetical protein
VHWPDSRRVVINLSFDVQEKKASPWLENWRSVHDLKPEHSVPADLAKHNRRAVKTGARDDGITRWRGAKSWHRRDK